jgi:hypothetical protein
LQAIAVSPLTFSRVSAIWRPRKTVLPRIPLGSAWRFIIHWGTCLEAITLLPVIGVCAMGLVLSRLILSGYQNVFFNSK